MSDSRPKIGDRVVVRPRNVAPGHGRVDMIDRSTFDWYYGVTLDNGQIVTMPEDLVEIENPLEALGAAFGVEHE